MARILCLDPGTRHTGVAVTDPTRTIAQAFATVEHADETALVARVAELAKEHEVELIVIGLPLGPDGAATKRSEQVTQLANRLRNRLKLPVELHDERYSSNRAAEILAESQADTYQFRPGPNTDRRLRPASKGRSRNRRLAADRLAAVLILEDYLSEKHPPVRQCPTEPNPE